MADKSNSQHPHSRLLVFCCCLLGGVAGLLLGGVITILMDRNPTAAGRMGVSLWVLLPVPVLTIVGLIAGAVVGVRMARKRKLQEETHIRKR